ISPLLSLPGFLLAPGCAFGPRTKPPQRMGGETRPSLAIPHPASPSYSHVRADIHWHTHTHPPLSPPPSRWLHLCARPRTRLGLPLWNLGNVQAVQYATQSRYNCRRHADGREKKTETHVEHCTCPMAFAFSLVCLLCHSAVQLDCDSGYRQIHSQNASRRKQQAHRKVNDVCVCVLSEAECLALQSKYRLITPSDLGNEKWNSGFPAGLWARLKRSEVALRFKDDKGYVLYPQIGDRLDLICPPLDTGRSTPEYEFYKLYLVSSREQADRCEVSGAPNIVLTCDEPTRERRFTIKFQEFSPNLWGHEFKSMQDYFIIATSDGTRQGLEGMRGGVCATQGMKVVLKVGQSQYGLPPKKEPPAGRTTSRNPGGAGNSTQSRGTGFGGEGGENGPLQPSNIALIAGAAGGSAFLLLVTAVICLPQERRGGGLGSSNNNGSEPSDIIIPLRTSDSAYCPHYEK
ncbi:hypothetical protein KUCAC02_000605, partial [Chaenocephalus aceratus]